MKKTPLNLEKISLNLFRGDFRRLRQLHGDEGGGAVVRRLVRDHIKQRNEEIRAGLNRLTPILDEAAE